MKDYGIGDYDIFDTGVAENHAFVTELEAFLTALTDCEATLSDTTVFEGPIAEDMINMFTTVKNDVNTIYDELNTMDKFLTQVSEAYKASDDAALKKLLTVEETTVEI